MIDELKKKCLSEDNGGCDEVIYSLRKIELLGYEVVKLRGGYLIVDVGEIIIQFCLLEHICEGDDDDDLGLEIVFYGSGVGGSLMECRHTFWGEGGYVFYINLRLVKDAMTHLMQLGF